MNRLAVPRGNPGQYFPNFNLSAASPRWSILTPDEQKAATATASKRLVIFLCMAYQTIRECLIDLRLARTVIQWREWSDRLKRVKAPLFADLDDETIRRRFLIPLQARFILLGAEREEAERIAPELVESVLRLRSVGTWRPPGADIPWYDTTTEDIRRPAYEEQARVEAERCWVEDGRVLCSHLTDWRESYLNHELRAFPEDPPPDPFLAARGPIFDRPAIALVPVARSETPPGFTRPAVECATQHVKELLFEAGALVRRVSRPEFQTHDHAYAAVQQLERLWALLRSAWRSNELSERFNRHRDTNFAVGGVVRPSVHEAAEELARAVSFAFRNAVCQVAFADSPETDRMWHGPWHWHEVLGAYPKVRERCPELLSAFEGVSDQTLEADLDRESSQLLASTPGIVPPSAPSTPPPNGSSGVETLAVGNGGVVEPVKGQMGGAAGNDDESGDEKAKEVDQPSSPVPFFPLTSWAEIFDSLNSTHPERPWTNDDRARGKIRDLNAQFEGPIKMPEGKGKQPEVEKAALLRWWAEAAEKFSAASEEIDRDADSKQATVAATHPHGKDGVVVPDIGGVVKKSKRKGKV